MPPRTCSFEVRGIPAPQGSKRHVGHGVMIESSKKVKPWREAVKAAAIEAMQKRGITQPFGGPLQAVIIFALPRPRAAPKSRIYPDRKPDLDKLLRSTLDALTDAGLISDDSRLVALLGRKVYAAPNTLMPWPGASIDVGTHLA